MEEELSFDWDAANIRHIARHGIVTAEIAEAFANETMDLHYEFVNGEERWTSIGHTNATRVLVIVWTVRGSTIRPVTAFDAGRRLAAKYFNQKGF